MVRRKDGLTPGLRGGEVRWACGGRWFLDGYFWRVVIRGGGEVNWVHDCLPFRPGKLDGWGVTDHGGDETEGNFVQGSTIGIWSIVLISVSVKGNGNGGMLRLRTGGPWKINNLFSKYYFLWRLAFCKVESSRLQSPGET